MSSKKLALSVSLVILTALTLGFVLSVISFNFAVAPDQSANAAASQSWTPVYNGSYYDGIDADKSGLALRAELEDLITRTHHTYTTYSGTSKGSLAWMYDQSDYDPNNRNNLIMWYTGTSVSGSAWNREHVWPKNGDPSKAFDGDTKRNGGSDAHHLRPCDNQLNSTRSSKSFDEFSGGTIVKENGSTNYANLCYTQGSFFYPGKGYRGATARILFYMQTRWGGTSNYNLYFVDAAGNNKNIGKISTLLKWHLEEPPSEAEIRRNNAVAEYQGNRNPFIDHPEYAAKIYCYTDGLKAIGGTSLSDKLLQVVDTYDNYGENRPDLESLTLSASVLNMTIGSEQTLTVSAVPSNANAKVTWSSSDNNVATVNNGKVTAVSDGTATITATSTENPQIKATATVQVKKAISLQISGQPNVTQYQSGQTFNPGGLTVSVTYSDGTSSTITDLSQLKWLDAQTGQSMLIASTTKIVCKLGDLEKECDFTVTVSAPPENISAFVSSVANITSEMSLNQRFNAIKQSLALYQLMTPAEKSSAQEAYNALLDKIDEYNTDIRKSNTDIQNYSAVGASAAVSVMLAVSAIAYVLQHKFN